MLWYFALFCADALLKTILIPKYSSTDNSPTNANVLNAMYHLAILSFKANAVDFKVIVSDDATDCVILFKSCVHS